MSILLCIAIVIAVNEIEYIIKAFDLILADDLDEEDQQVKIRHDLFNIFMLFWFMFPISLI